MKKLSTILFVTILISLFSGCNAAQNPYVKFEYREIDPASGHVEIADVDNDGKNDVVLVGNGTFAWFKYENEKTFKKSVIITGAKFSSDRIAIGDIDKDGDIDIVTGCRKDKKYYTYWLENPLPAASPDTPGSWKMHEVGANTDYLKDIIIKDFDKDNKPDIVVRQHHDTILFLQKSPTEWINARVLEHESHEGMDVADLDNDGDPDIVLNGFWFETPDDVVNGTFKKHIIDKLWFTPVDKTWRDNNSVVKVADINGDGLCDILLCSSELPGFPISAYIASSLEDIKQDKWKETQIEKVFDYCQTLDAADIDGDGDVDVVAGKFERQVEPRNPQWTNYPPFPVVIYYNENGKGTQWGKQKLSDEGVYSGVLGDVGSDGDIDFISSRSYWTGPIKLWENKIH